MRRFARFSLTLLLVGCGVEPLPTIATDLDPCVQDARPTTIDAAVAHARQLPEPTIRCFLASLSRPLAAVASHSTTSTQQSTVDDPRVFLFLDDLVISTTAAGDAAGQLEFGERIDAGHSIKAELHEPFDEDPYAAVAAPDGGTRCGICHADERPVDGFTDRFVSKGLRPQRDQLVPLGDGALDHLACDDDSERCARLAALYAHGAVDEVAFGPGYDVLF